MQEDFFSVSNEWTDIEDVTTIESDVTYYIQNRGPDMLVALESSDTPDDTQEGVMMPPYIQGIYVKGAQKLYLRAFNKLCTINITKAE